MAAIKPTTRVKTEGYKKLATLVKAGLSAGGPADNPIRRMFTRWASRFESFIRRRFMSFSRGGGDWAALAASTIKRRRDGRKRKKATKKGPAQSRVVSILVDTGIMKNALQIGAPGNILRPAERGIEYGIGGAITHNAGGPSIGQLAIWHHYGAGRLPPRKIIVPPDAETKRGMNADAEVCIKELIKQSKG